MSEPNFFSRPTAEELLTQLRRIVAEHGPDQEPAALSTAPAAVSASSTEQWQLTRERVLEDLLHEMLQPMIQRWLDQELESLVVRVVREEVSRARRIHDEARYEGFAAMIVSLILRKKRRPRLGDQRCS
jgi:cell pole-organizing protein PopZ